MAIPVKLPVFEGPLDLLMHLIEKNKIDIYDIPIVEITDQYLEYVHQMDHEDMDVTSEFLVMAATLLDIKSRMLLPREKDEETGEEEGDPREELVRRLLEYKMYKYMSEELAVCREQAGVRYFREQDLPKEVRSYQPPIDYEDLLKGTDLKRLETVFGEVLRRKKSRRDPIRSGFGKIKREEVNIDTKTLYIRAYLKAHPQTDFRALLESQESKEEVIVTFLILLELMKHQKVHIIQDSICGKILIESSEAEANSSSALSEEPSLHNADEENAETAEDTQAQAPESAPAEDIQAQAPETEDMENSAAEILDEEEFVPEYNSDGSDENSFPAGTPGEKSSEIRPLSFQTRMEVVSPVLPLQTGMEAVSPVLPLQTGMEAVSPVLPFQTGMEAVSPVLPFDPAPQSPPFEITSASEEIVLPESGTPENSAENNSAENNSTENNSAEMVPISGSMQDPPVHFSAHLWYGKVPGHVSPLCDFRGGSTCASRFGRQAASRRLRRVDPVWEQTRLSRLWARRL